MVLSRPPAHWSATKASRKPQTGKNGQRKRAAAVSTAAAQVTPSKAAANVGPAPAKTLNAGTGKGTNAGAPPAPETTARTVDTALMRLSQKVGLHATNCTAALIAGRHADIVRESAAFLHALEQLWAHEAVEPSDVWTELLRRLEVAELLHQLNQPPHRKKSRGKVPRPWRITTSKLP